MLARAVSWSLFVYLPEEWIMTQNVKTQAAAQPIAAAKDRPAAPTIAVRKRCNPDGIGLSHYVLMDKQVAK
jgi:modified peptide precursor CbpA